MLLALALAAAAASFAPPAEGKTGSETGYARIERACPPPQPGEATCFALLRRPVAASQAGAPGVHPFTLRAGAASAGPAGGLTPAQLASAYGYGPSATGGTQTVAIVDAFDDPKIEADLAAFDAEYKLAPCTEADKCFEKVGQTGEPTSLPAADKEGWSVEISLDVEAVHAACPNCKILLVEANNSEFRNLGAAVKAAATLGATEISNSYGGYEFKPSAEEEADYTRPGVVVAAATGDQGWNSWVRAYEHFAPPAPARPNTPSSLPSVVAVGGTSLKLTAGETRASETVWNDDGTPFSRPTFVEGATGGGCSIDFAAPLWQQDVAGFPATGCGSKRSAADVAAVADPLTGFDIFDSFNCGEVCKRFKNGKSWLTIGGTSLSTPLISAMYALAGGANGVSFPALTLYGHLGDASATFDVTQGGNGYCNEAGASCGVDETLAKEGLPEWRFDCEGTTSCNASGGFDGPSGVGAPASLRLFEPLLPTASITLPSRLLSGVPLGFSAAGSTDPYPGGTTGTTYSWTFGDGATASGAAPSHTYTAAGSYTVKLTITDGYGLKSAAKTAEISVAEPSAKETADEEAARHKGEEEAAKHKAEEEAARHKGEEEAAKRKAEEEAAARTRAGEEAARKAAETPLPGSGSTGIASFTATSPDATLVGSSLKASANGAFTVKIGCPAGESSCEGTVTVQTAGAVLATAKARVLRLASSAFKVAGGKVVAVTLRLSRKGRSLLARKRSLRVSVTIASHDPAGASHTGHAAPSLRAAGRRR
jgi:hypothetical protein